MVVTLGSGSRPRMRRKSQSRGVDGPWPRRTPGAPDTPALESRPRQPHAQAPQRAPGDRTPRRLAASSARVNTGRFSVDDRFERARALFFAALASQQAGELEHAERQYRSSLSSSPAAPRRSSTSRRCSILLARPLDALASADAALAAEADSVDALLHRATALADLGRLDEALATFERLLAMIRTTPRRGAEAAACCAR